MQPMHHSKRSETSSSSSSSSQVETTTEQTQHPGNEKDEPPPGQQQQRSFGTHSARILANDGLTITTDSDGLSTAKPTEQVAIDTNIVDATTTEATNNNNNNNKSKTTRPAVQDQPARTVPLSGFNVVLTHCTADFDSLASAVGLAKLWSSQHQNINPSIVDGNYKSEYDSSSHLPTFVVLPRGAHPSVQRFLALHKHLFPIRSLKSLPSDLSGLNRLGLVDAQRRDRIGPAEPLLEYAKRVTIVDHHLDSDSDIPEATDYVLEKVGSVSTLIAERLEEAQLKDGLTEAEATLLALGIHADTGSLCYDSTTPRDAKALAWVMEQGASQTAIAEHSQQSLSQEQQSVLTQALINTNSTVVHGVTVASVLLEADGFINGLAAVTQDALELSSSDIYLLGIVYEPKSGGSRKNKQPGERITTHILQDGNNGMETAKGFNGSAEETFLRQRLRVSFDSKDLDGSGYLTKKEISAALSASGIIAATKSVEELLNAMDKDGDGRIEFEEFVDFAKAQTNIIRPEKRQSTLIVIGRVKAGVGMKSVKLGKLLEKYGGGGHAKAASATVRLNDESEAASVLSSIVDEVIETSLAKQPAVGDFMTAPVLSVRPDMSEKQVEDLFIRYDVRALPVVDGNNDVIGLVTYKEVAAAKERMWNKEQKRLRQEVKAAAKGKDPMTEEQKKIIEERRRKGSAVKAWMLQHVMTIEASRTMAEVETILLENDVGCIPVVVDGTMQLVGMVTRTDILRQHQYYPSLHYHNKGFSDSIAARKPIIELRKRLKKFDLDQ
jgi:nanoRNase/pAp phosphatase (c-di-AMP/oligoRNAs hydrolase)